MYRMVYRLLLQIVTWSYVFYHLNSCYNVSVDGWSLEQHVTSTKHNLLTNGNDKTNDNIIQCRGHRREFLNRLSILVTSSATSLLPNMAQSAVITSSSSSSLYNEIQQRLPLGHARVKYLLDHWDDITSICGTSVMSDIERKQIIRTEGGGGSNSGDTVGCIKTPLRVQEFMGYKSINDPLYRIDKLLIKADTFVNANDYDNYIDTVEQYRTTADATALLAYTSSWGEANPYVLFFLVLYCRFNFALRFCWNFWSNERAYASKSKTLTNLFFFVFIDLTIIRNGSKEVIEEYLDQTKAQVIVSEQLLRNILQYLNLQPLPSIQGKLYL
jgi:hypothetical protein